MALAELEPHWSWLFDEIVPAYVKRAYSPREAWRERPFTRQDAIFQVKAIRELSMRLTVERVSAGGRPQARGYLEQARFRAAYLLYFLPLQAAKLAQLLTAHASAVDAAIADAERRGKLVVVDLGAGPGTASIALLLELARRGARGQRIPRTELHWFDQERRILKDGLEIASALVERSPALTGHVVIERHVDAWTEAPRLVTEPWSLAFLGHTLNEGRMPPLAVWKRMLDRTPRGGGLLVVEPASKGNAQQLARVRDELFATGTIPADATALWGPCLHAGVCPLAEGRDWCHLSVPAQIPGQWFAFFSRGLGSERNWLKYSYLWLAAAGDPAPEPAPRARRVVSDPLKKTGGAELLLCEPGRVARVAVKGSTRVRRGDLFTIA